MPVLTTRINPALVAVECDYCRKHHRVALSQDQERRLARGQLIEHAAPHLTPAERELLMGGVCGECFARLTATDKGV